MNHAIAILPLALLLGAQEAPPRSPFYTLPESFSITRRSETFTTPVPPPPGAPSNDVTA